MLSGAFDFNKVGYFDFFEHKKFLDRWSSSFGKTSICVRLFQKSDLKDGDFLADFCSHINIDTNCLKRPALKNQSLSCAGLQFLSIANKHIPNIQDEGRSHLRGNLVALLQSITEGSPFYPCRSEAVNFYERFRMGNQSVAKEYFGRTNYLTKIFPRIRRAFLVR